MTAFIDPDQVSEELAWGKFNLKNLIYIGSKSSPNASNTLHFAGPDHYTDQTEPFNENTATDDTMIQVAIVVPNAWCKAMTKNGHFVEGDQFYCKAHSNDELVPMSFNTSYYLSG